MVRSGKYAKVIGKVIGVSPKEGKVIVEDVHKVHKLSLIHIYSREQFELRTHKRLIDIIKPSQKAVEALMGMELPAGVDIEIKL